MLSPDDVTNTGPIEQLPRSFDRRSALNERRHHILQQKQTETLPRVVAVAPSSKGVFRRANHLRKENQRLHAEVEALRTQMRQMAEEYEQNFQIAVEEEAHKVVVSATQTLEFTPAQSQQRVRTSPLIEDVKKTIELHAQQVEDVQLVETLYLKREAQRMLARLQQAQKQLDDERQKLLVMQNTVREQAQLRYKLIDTRLRARWRAAFAVSIIGLLLLLVILQIVFLALLHVAMGAALDVSLIGPLVISSLLALLLAHPVGMFRSLYQSIPHKEKKKKVIHA